MFTDKMKWRYAFGANLERVMKSVGYSQKRLAEETGMAQSTISSYIRGEYSPSITSVVVMCQVMCVDYNVLLEADLSEPIVRRYEFFNEPLGEAQWADDFGMIFRTMLLKESCSQSELSFGTGISQGLISKYLKGYTIPSAYAIMRIAHYLAYEDNYDELIELGRVEIRRGW